MDEEDTETHKNHKIEILLEKFSKAVELEFGQVNFKDSKHLGLNVESYLDLSAMVPDIYVKNYDLEHDIFLIEAKAILVKNLEKLLPTPYAEISSSISLTKAEMEIIQSQGILGPLEEYVWKGECGYQRADLATSRDQANKLTHDEILEAAPVRPIDFEKLVDIKKDILLGIKEVSIDLLMKLYMMDH